MPETLETQPAQQPEPIDPGSGGLLDKGFNTVTGLTNQFSAHGPVWLLVICLLIPIFVLCGIFVWLSVDKLPMFESSQREEIQATRALQDEIKSFKSELSADLAALETEMRVQGTQMNSELRRVSEDVTSLKSNDTATIPLKIDALDKHLDRIEDRLSAYRGSLEQIAELVKEDIKIGRYAIERPRPMRSFNEQYEGRRYDERSFPPSVNSEDDRWKGMSRSFRDEESK